MSSKTLKLSVTTLANFACRKGDLELTSAHGPSAREGMRAHQRIQKKIGMDVEVRVAATRCINNVFVTLSGRIDLLDVEQHVVGEIKSTLIPADKIAPGQQDLNWAQVMLYGFCYWQNLKHEQEHKQGVTPVEIKTIQLELLYVNILTDTETRLTRTVGYAELVIFADEALRCYVKWMRILWAWQERTRRTAKALKFPHRKFRHGQRDMAAAIYRGVRDKGTLLCEAPTGIGKTVSGLFPAIKSIGDDVVNHVLYLTAKTSGRRSAMQAIRLLESHGLQTTAIVIRSKKTTCFCSNGRTTREDCGTCPMTSGFFDRLSDARAEAIERGVLDGDVLDEIAWKHRICPFEFALQLLPWVALVVCDFNYVFDPLVRLSRFNEPRRDTALLIDEAHNLLDRSRSMYSAELRRSEFLSAVSNYRTSQPVLADKLKSMGDALLMHSRGTSEDVLVAGEAPAGLVRAAGKVLQALMDNMAENAVQDDQVELFKALCRFIAIYDLYAAQHRTLTRTDFRGRRKEVAVQLCCLDAAEFLTLQYRMFRSTALFSATLRPAEFYRDALGLSSTTLRLSLSSPFDPERVKHLMVPYVDTRYRQREFSSMALADLMADVVKQRPGSYLVFFPSYAYLQQILLIFNSRHPTVETWYQESNADMGQRDSQLKQLDIPGHRLGFAILGGVFGEGIDYVGDRLIGAIVVGIGLPATSTEQDLIADHYRSKGLDGYDFAYRYPGFTRVLQTAGRVIRTESDNGIVVLVDDRFQQSFYRTLFPHQWHLQMANNEQALRDEIQNFWVSIDRIEQQELPGSKSQGFFTERKNVPGPR